MPPTSRSRPASGVAIGKVRYSRKLGRWRILPSHNGPSHTDRTWAGRERRPRRPLTCVTGRLHTVESGRCLRMPDVLRRLRLAIAGVVTESAARMSRRQMLSALSVAGVGAACHWQVPAYAAQAPSAAGTLPLAPLNRFPRMVQEFFVSASAVQQQRLEPLGGLENEGRRRGLRPLGPGEDPGLLRPVAREDAAQPPRHRRRRARRLPHRESDLREPARTSSSRPICMSRRAARCRCPASSDVRALGQRQGGRGVPVLRQGLARLGYVVLIFDPDRPGRTAAIRRRELEAGRRRARASASTCYAGNQQFLVGEFFGAWRAWDGIRALDYLLTREEVDPRHVGVTGNSGGGTMTTWLCGLERRWTMAAPELLRHDASPQHGERAARRHASSARRGRSRWASTTPTSWRRWPPSR